MNISNNISSIGAHQTMLDTTANNIANINTDKFVPKDVKITNISNSVHANVREMDDSGTKRSQTDLVKEISNEIIAQDATTVNINVIKAQDEMMGTILNIKV